LISSWSPESADNARILQSTGIASNWEYRKYLTASGADIMRTNFREMCNDSGYQHPPMTRDTGAPASFASFSDASRPFGYADSDLKQTYLTREQLQARKVAPVFSDFAR
jgi:hypothetical protein